MGASPSFRHDPCVVVDRSLVQSLAREYDQPEHEVERILREEIRRITAQARIHTFVTVLAASSARTRLRQGLARSH